MNPQLLLLALRPRVREILPDLISLGVLVVLPVLVFWRVWAPNPADRLMFGGDLLMGAYPTRVFVHQLFRAGNLPLWNPYQLSGMPLAGDIQVAAYYAPNLLLGWLRSEGDLSYLHLEMLVIAHYILGAFGLYIYLRGLRVMVVAALFGAIAFEFNGFFIGHRGHYSMLAAAAWLPMVLALLDRSWGTASRRQMLVWAILAGLALSQLLMGGHPQAALYCSTLIALYAGWKWLRACRAAQRTDRWRAITQIPIIMLLAGCVALGIAAVAIMPAAELLGRSLRSAPTYEFSTQFSLPPRNLVTLLIPELLNWGTTEFRIYAGVSTLVLAWIALAIPSQARPERRFFAIAIIVALLIAVGGFTAFQGILYRFLPGFGSIRVSARAFYIANVALPILAAFGVETLLLAPAAEEQQRLRRFVRILWGLNLTVAVGGGLLYVLLAMNYQPTGEEAAFGDPYFRVHQSGDTFGLLGQTANQYLLFAILLFATTVLLTLCINQRGSQRMYAYMLVLLITFDITTFAPYHDTLKADPEHARFVVRNYASTLLDRQWQVQDQQQLINAISRLPDGVRVDNTAEVLPDNYSQQWRVPFSSGYNILDLKERFELLTTWPHLSDTTRRDLSAVGYILSLPDQPMPPELGAQMVISNTQGILWKRAQQPAYAQFSTQIRNVQPSIAINALLSRPDTAMNQQPAIASDTQSLRSVLATHWPALTQPELYGVGTTGVISPVDLSVLAGGPIKYSAVIVDGKTVTPERRGIVMALIDPQHGTVISADAYDTYQLESEGERLAAVIESSPPGTIIALATYDEGTARLNQRARAALASLGAQTSLGDAFGKAYALIGVAGAPGGSALERLGDTPQVLDVGVGAASGQSSPMFQYQLIRYEPDRIVLLAENSSDGLLTIAETVYPGWRAYVDGVAVPILRANGIQRAIILPRASAGMAHEVTLIYEPLSMRLGSAVSLATLVSVTCLLVTLSVHPFVIRIPVYAIAEQ